MAFLLLHNYTDFIQKMHVEVDKWSGFANFFYF